MSDKIKQGSRESLQEAQFGPKTRQIPDDWEVGRLGNNTYLKGRIGWHGLTQDDHLEDGEYFLVTGTDFENGRVKWNRCKYVNEDWYEKDPNIQLKEKDILVTKDGSIGKVAFVEPLPGKATLNNGVFVIRPTNGEYQPKFFYYILNSSYFDDFIETITAGSTISHLYQKDFVNFRFPLPSLPEQRRIADILSTVDEKIHQTGEIVNKMEELKRGVLNELIPSGIDERGGLRPSPEDRPELYEEVRRCTVPAEWEVASLQELCKGDVTYGIVQAGPHIDDGVPYIKTGDMTDGQLEVEELSRTSTEIAEDYSRSKIKTGELVIAIRATVGVVHQVPPELDGANLTQGTARISPKDMIDNRYLLWTIRTNLVQSLIDARTKGSTFNEITLGTLRKVPIPYPERFKEQQRIAEKLDKILEKLEQERAYLTELKNLKRGLMQDLLTGKIRVNTD